MTISEFVRKLLIANPRIVELPTLMAKPVASVDARLPSISITGVVANVGWLVPSIVIGWVIVGRPSPPGWIVHTPDPTSQPGSVSTGMWKLTVSAPAVLLAAVIASRKLMTLSAPGFTLRSLIDVVPPSTISLVESTTTISAALLAMTTGSGRSSTNTTRSPRASLLSRIANAPRIDGILATFATKSLGGVGASAPESSVSRSRLRIPLGPPDVIGSEAGTSCGGCGLEDCDFTDFAAIKKWRLPPSVSTTTRSPVDAPTNRALRKPPPPTASGVGSRLAISRLSHQFCASSGIQSRSLTVSTDRFFAPSFRPL